MHINASLNVGPTAKRLKASAGISKQAPRSEEPQPRAKTLTPSVVDVASDNVNYAAEVAGISHDITAAKQYVASTDPRVIAGTSQADNATGNLAIVFNKAAT